MKHNLLKQGVEYFLTYIYMECLAVYQTPEKTPRISIHNKMVINKKVGIF